MVSLASARQSHPQPVCSLGLSFSQVIGWLVPPLAVLMRFGIGKDFFINIIFTVMGELCNPPPLSALIAHSDGNPGLFRIHSVSLSQNLLYRHTELTYPSLTA
jgi:hypothetical protein